VRAPGDLRQERTYFLGISTDRRLRPLRRRAASTLLPLWLALRSRKPCLFFRFRLLGWYVRFTGRISSNVSGLPGSGCGTGARHNHEASDVSRTNKAQTITHNCA
jgi:hypothetical protein